MKTILSISVLIMLGGCAPPIAFVSTISPTDEPWVYVTRSNSLSGLDQASIYHCKDENEKPVCRKAKIANQ